MVKNIVAILRFVVQYVYVYLTVKIRSCWIGTLSNSFKLVFHHHFSQVQSFLYKRFDWFFFNYILISSLPISMDSEKIGNYKWTPTDYITTFIFYAKVKNTWGMHFFVMYFFIGWLKAPQILPLQQSDCFTEEGQKIVRLSFIKQN